MPVLEKPKIKKEDLGELADTFLEKLPEEIEEMPIAHFYLVGNTLCVETPDYDSLILAPDSEVRKYADPKNYAVVYESTSENGTHRIAVYKRTNNANSNIYKGKT